MDDHLTKYREFFESLVKNCDLSNPLYNVVPRYTLTESEFPGEILNWCLHYLNDRGCPASLAPLLCQKAFQEVVKYSKENPEECGYRPNEDDFNSLKLVQVTINKLVELCERYSDNAMLSTLPPLPSERLIDPHVSVCAVKNGRRKMEDRHLIVQDLHTLFNIKGCGPASFYAVFDGHNGTDAATYSCAHLHQFLVENPNYPENPVLALSQAFQQTDERFIDKSKKNENQLESGTTVVCVLLRPYEKKLYTAWLGDSQAVLVSKSGFRCLVSPHRPNRLDERQRIERMGGVVLHLGIYRVNGFLAVSRAIGDTKYKPYIMSEPDITTIDLVGDEEFMVIASDGLWDFISPDTIILEVYSYISQQKGPVKDVAKYLTQLAKTKSEDNISVVVVFLTEPTRFEPGMDEVISVRWTQEHPVHNGNETSSPRFDDDMLGPETNVDEPVEEVGMVAKAKALVDQAKSMEGWVKERRLDNSETQWLQTLPWSYADVVKKSEKEENPSKEDAREDAPEKAESDREKSDISPEISDKEVKAEENDVADGESEEDSEEEWNYTPGKENKDPSQVVDEEDDMSQLNPNAAEFVPVFTSVKETVLASSPAKGTERSLENVAVPTLDDFLSDISHKPCDKSLVEDKEEDVADLTAVSTKAELGDESLMACNLSDIKDEKLNETNPFAEDKIQDDMVQNHFGTDFKFEIDPMQQSFIKTPEEEIKPDLISPVKENQNEQQTSSSGFDSESGNDEPDLTSNEKCDLVAEIHAEDKNPFVMDEGVIETESLIPSPETNGQPEESPLVETFADHFSAPNVPDFLVSNLPKTDDSQGESDEFEMINPTEVELKEMNGFAENDIKTELNNENTEDQQNLMNHEVGRIGGMSPMDFTQQHSSYQENYVNNEVDDLIGSMNVHETKTEVTIGDMDVHESKTEVTFGDLDVLEPKTEVTIGDMNVHDSNTEVTIENMNADVHEAEIHDTFVEEIEKVEPEPKTQPDLIEPLEIQKTEELEPVQQKSEPVELPQEIPEEIKPLECSNVDVETLQKFEADTVATPPSTPAPGPVEEPKEDKDNLIAAAFAAAGAVAAAGVVAAEAVKEEKPEKEEKTKEEEKSKEEVKEEVKKAVANKKPDMKTSPSKTTATKTAAAKPAAAPAKKPTTTLTKAPAARPASSTTRPTSATAMKANPKPSTPLTRVAPKPASKPTTPVTKTAAKPAPKPASPVVSRTAVKPDVKAAPKPAAKPPVKTEIKKTEVKPITRPTSATSTTSRPSSASSTTARTSLAAKTPITKTTLTKPTPKPTTTVKTTLTKTTTTTAAKPAPKPAPIKAPVKAPLTKPAAKPAVSSTTAKPAAKAPVPASKAVPKTKAAPTALKKPLNDKTVKETANLKLTKKEEPKQVEQVEQEPIVTTTNGHNGLIENGHHETVEV